MNFLQNVCLAHLINSKKIKNPGERYFLLFQQHFQKPFWQGYFHVCQQSSLEEIPFDNISAKEGNADTPTISPFLAMFLY